MTRLEILLLSICYQSETVIAIAVLNESGGNGGWLLNKSAKLLLRSQKERTVLEEKTWNT